MRKLIIVEGMDNTGKDTQIKRIVNRYPNDIFHTLHYHAVKSRTPAEARMLAEMTYDSMFGIIETCTWSSFILNRSHYGEYVYGKIYRDYPDPEYVFELERRFRNREVLLRDRAVLIVFVNTDFETLAAREDGDSLSQGKISLIKSERDRFTSVYELSAVDPMRKCLINTAGKNIEEVSAMVDSFLDRVYE